MNMALGDRPLVLVGGGGHAKSLISALMRAGVRPEGILDGGLMRGTHLMGIEVMGDDGLLPALAAKGYAALLAVGSVKNNKSRAEIFDRLKAMGIALPAFTAASALVGLDVHLGQGTVVLETAVINTSAHIGENCIINTGAIVEHDVLMADHVHVAPGALLGGGVSVGQRAFIGAGAIVRQGLNIGANAVVGAGAVVVKDVPEGRVVVGCPAR